MTIFFAALFSPFLFLSFLLLLFSFLVLPAPPISVRSPKYGLRPSTVLGHSDKAQWDWQEILPSSCSPRWIRFSSFPLSAQAGNREMGPTSGIARRVSSEDLLQGRGPACRTTTKPSKKKAIPFPRKVPPLQVHYDRFGRSSAINLFDER